MFFGKETKNFRRGARKEGKKERKKVKGPLPEKGKETLKNRPSIRGGGEGGGGGGGRENRNGFGSVTRNIRGCIKDSIGKSPRNRAGRKSSWGRNVRVQEKHHHKRMEAINQKS